MCQQYLQDDLDLILRETSHAWEELRNGRLFITGGTGFFGCWLLESFLYANLKLNLNASVYVLTRNPESFHDRLPHLANNRALVLYEGDVCTFNYPEGCFSHIIHAAKVTDTVDGVPQLLSVYDRTLQGTRHVLDFARHCSASKVLFTSSGAIYGRQPKDLLFMSEEYIGSPDLMDEKSAYGEGKRASEFLCSMYAKHYDIEVKIARCFTFLGPYFSLESDFAICNFIKNVLSGQHLYVNGDGTPYRSYLYASELTVWLWTILFKGKSNRPYNVGSEHQISIADLANLVVNVSGKEIAINIKTIPQKISKPDRYIPATHRALHELGLRQTVSLKEAIKRTLTWYMARES